ncbi:MAG: YceI family protein [Deltaproteobacteria bacterium]|nr:YceI family protein [Deltaproteobacteria bacterium]
MRRFGKWLFVLTLILVPAIASAQSFAIDPAHTTVGFSAKHFGVSNVAGAFSDVTGSLEWDGKNLETAKTEIKIAAKSVDTRNAKRDDHLRNADFFEAAKFPSIAFKSKSVKLTGQNTATVVGDLTIKAITKEVTLDVTFNGTVDDPWGNERAGFSATGKLNRHDWGVTAPGATDKAIGDEIKITIETEFTRPKK